MAKESVLIIEDEEDIRELVNYNLSKEGYQTTAVESGEEGFKTAKSKQPNLIVLDLMLPGMDGLEICKLLKADPKTQHIPIVMLTAKGEESDVVTGLELGADDYLTKPFSPKVLVARIRTILRRKSKTEAGDDAVLAINEMTIHPGRHEVLIKGKQTELTLTEFKILHLLARRPGWVFTRYQIVNEIRGDEVLVTDRSVDVQIVGLRRKLGPHGKNIETVRGVGYRFKE
ncbi:MAG: response regulator transcription factor [candidate division Zixibacteria bacterium]|nr:response regulator transcription factor [candidate division Zixibacteria bacterium]